MQADENDGSPHENAGDFSIDSRFTMDGSRQASAEASRSFCDVVVWLFATTDH